MISPSETNAFDHHKKALFVGRKKEINQLFEMVNSGQKNVTLLLGEAGIGKSSLLEAFYQRLWDQNQSSYFVGFYDQTKELRSSSLLHPFITALESLLKWGMDTEKFDDKLEESLKRLQNAFIKFLKEKGTEMAGAIIQDIAEKVGLKETLKLAKDFLKTVKAEKSIRMLAESYVSENKGEAVYSYVNILSSLAEEFNDRNFVLIFDQFESVGKASIDFLVDSIMNMPVKFHVIISFRTAEVAWEDTASRKLYDYAVDLVQRQGAKVINIKGLSEEEIGEWVKYAKGIDLPMVPDLKRIRENSSGFPMLLNEWINYSQELNYDEINRNQLCVLVNKRKKKLDDKNENKMLNRMAVLIRPLRMNDLCEYLNVQIDYLQVHLEELEQQELIERKEHSYSWFRHELIQRCIEDGLEEELKKKYHEDAAKFYSRRFEKDKKSGNLRNDTAVGLAYHLHRSGMYEKSYIRNKDLAIRASYVGDLDLAERCYNRAIDDAEQLGRIDQMMECFLDLTHDVYITWGRYHEAYGNYQDLLKFFQIDSEQHVLVLNYMAQLHYIKKQYDEALKNYEESLSVMHNLKNQNKFENQILEAEIAHGAGMVYYDKKKYDEALGFFEKSLDTARRAGSKLGVLSSSCHIANVYRSTRNYEDALNLLKEILPQVRETRNKSLMAEILHGLAKIYDERGQYDEALQLLDDRLSIEKKLGNQSGIAFTLAHIGKVLIKKDRPQIALPYISEAHLILMRLNLPDAELVLEDLRSIEDTKV